MNLRSTVFLSAYSSAVRVLSGLLINKFVAVYWGPTGLAVVGQTQNFLNISSHALTLGGSNAVVKTLAASESERERAALLKLAMLVLSLSYATALVLLVLLRSELPSLFFIPQVAPNLVLLVLAACLPFVSLYTLSLAIFNGDRRMRPYFSAMALNATCMLLFTIPGLRFLGEAGLLAALCSSYVATFLFCLWRRVFRIPMRQILASRIPNRTRRQSLRNLAFMSLVAAIVAPTAMLIIRGILAGSLGTDWAGLWDGLLRISDAYLMIFTVPLAAYFLPAFSRAEDGGRQRKELLLGLGFVIALLPVAAALVFLLREWLIVLLYDPRFLVIADIMHIQLSADLVRMLGWVLGYFMLAREMTRQFVAAELLAAAIQVALATRLVPDLGVAGAVWSMFGGYASYLLFCAYVVYRHFGGRRG